MISGTNYFCDNSHFLCFLSEVLDLNLMKLIIFVIVQIALISLQLIDGTGLMAPIISIITEGFFVSLHLISDSDSVVVECEFWNRFPKAEIRRKTGYV